MLNILLATKFLTGNQQSTPATPARDSPGKSVLEGADPTKLPPAQVVPYWPLGSNLDMHVYLSNSPRTDVFSRLAYPHLKGKDADLPHFTWQNITYGDYNDYRVIDFEVKFPEVSSLCPPLRMNC